MLKMIAIGNITNDVELKMNESANKPYAILRLAAERRYKDRDGNKLTDFISVKVRGKLAENVLAKFALLRFRLKPKTTYAPLLVLFPPNPLRWASAGTLLGNTAIKAAKLRQSAILKPSHLQKILTASQVFC